MIVVLVLTATTSFNGDGYCSDSLNGDDLKEGNSDETVSKTEESDIFNLIAQLRDTEAIGLPMKLALKRQIGDLLSKFRLFHAHEGDTPLVKLREEFNLLLTDIIRLLRDKDPDLFRQITKAREVLWNKLTKPDEFSP